MSDVGFRSDMDVRLIDRMGSDLSAVAAAKVSTAGVNSLQEFEVDPQARRKFIDFLVKNRHGSPFEHSAMTFLISAPIFVFREFHRHRAGWSYNEVSGRYSELEPVFYLPNGRRPMVQVGKPGAYEFERGDFMQFARTNTSLADSFDLAWLTYQGMLDDGVAREVARMVLPVSIYSIMYATCNARSLMHFLSLRTKSDHAAVPSFPQHEIQMVADQMEAIFAEKFPVTHAAWDANGRVPV